MHLTRAILIVTCLLLSAVFTAPSLAAPPEDKQTASGAPRLSKANRELLARAEAGEADYQNELAFCYFVGSKVGSKVGRSFPEDDAQCARWYAKAAAGGNAEAQYEYGYFLKSGIMGTQQDEKAACQWFAKSAAQGYFLGEAELGRCYKSGRGLERDGKKAEYWFLRAAAQYYYGGASDLAELYSDGKALPVNEEAARAWSVTEKNWICSPRDYALATEENLDCQAAALAGNAQAQYALGQALRDGELIPKDNARAIYWLTKAAEQEHGEAQRDLAGLLLVYDGAGPDRVKKAEAWMLRSLDKKSAYGSHHVALALFYHETAAVRDPAKYIPLYLKALDSNLTMAEATHTLGNIYRQGDGVPVDFRKAFQYYYRAAVLHNHGPSQLALGRMYAYGLGVPKDPREALEWFEDADENGEVGSLGHIWDIKEKLGEE